MTKQKSPVTPGKTDEQPTRERDRRPAHEDYSNGNTRDRQPWNVEPVQEQTSPPVRPKR